MTNIWSAVAADIVAVTLLAYVVYYRRYFRLRSNSITQEKVAGVPERHDEILAIAG